MQLSAVGRIILRMVSPHLFQVVIPMVRMDYIVPLLVVVAIMQLVKLVLLLAVLKIMQMVREVHLRVV